MCFLFIKLVIIVMNPALISLQALPALGLLAIMGFVLVITFGGRGETLPAGWFLALSLTPLWYWLARSSVNRIGTSATFLVIVFPYLILGLNFTNKLASCLVRCSYQCDYSILGDAILVFVIIPAIVLITAFGLSIGCPSSTLVPYALPYALWLPEDLFSLFMILFSVATITALLSSFVALFRIRSHPPSHTYNGLPNAAIVAGLILTAAGFLAPRLLANCNYGFFF